MDWLARTLETRLPAALAWRDDSLDELLTHYLRDQRLERWDWMPVADQAGADPVFDYYTARLAALINARKPGPALLWRMEPDGGNLLRLWRTACEKSRTKPRLKLLLLVEPPMSAAFSLSQRLPASSLHHALYALTVNLIELERHSRGLKRALLNLFATSGDPKNRFEQVCANLRLETKGGLPALAPPSPVETPFEIGQMHNLDESVKELWQTLEFKLDDWDTLGKRLDEIRARWYPQIEQARPFCVLERQRQQGRIKRLSANKAYYEERVNRFTDKVLNKWYFKLGYQALNPREAMRDMKRRARDQAGRTLRRLWPPK
jgi:hypothetical protein